VTLRRTAMAVGASTRARNDGDDDIVHLGLWALTGQVL
jgi:hypothetical protein